MISLPRFRIVAAAVTCLAVTSVVAYIYLAQSAGFAQPIFPLGTVPDHACDDSDKSSSGGGQQEQTTIPNIVHYVWVLQDRRDFRLSFRTFVSVYSAHILWRPERIYIHTDAEPVIIEKATKVSLANRPWTRRVLAIPGVTLNYVKAPEVTFKDVAIKHPEHKADFLRIAALREFGGIYLDTDAVPLRDVTDLRRSGFANVLGGAVALSTRHSGYINNGVMMSVPHSTLMTIYYHAAQEFFDGEWATASVHVLTDLANRLLPLRSEVLILQPRAFAPTSWEFEDQKRLFAPILNAPTTDGEAKEKAEGDNAEDGDLQAATCRSALTWLRKHESETAAGARGEHDFSSTYVLHAFDNMIADIRGWDGQIDPRYVLARRSNYARAVYPVVRHAVQAGVITKEEIE